MKTTIRNNSFFLYYFLEEGQVLFVNLICCSVTKLEVAATECKVSLDRVNKILKRSRQIGAAAIRKIKRIQRRQLLQFLFRLFVLIQYFSTTIQSCKKTTMRKTLLENGRIVISLQREQEKEDFKVIKETKNKNRVMCTQSRTSEDKKNKDFLDF